MLFLYFWLSPHLLPSQFLSNQDHPKLEDFLFAYRLLFDSTDAELVQSRLETGTFLSVVRESRLLEDHIQRIFLFLRRSFYFRGSGKIWCLEDVSGACTFYWLFYTLLSVNANGILWRQDMGNLRYPSVIDLMSLLLPKRLTRYEHHPCEHSK